MDENETKSLLNKRMDELTVRDLIVVNIAVPIIAIGGFVVGAGVLAAGGKISDKYRKFKTDRQIKKIEEAEKDK